MTTFDTEFVMELFLDDTVSTMNRLIVATANVLNENFENMNNISDVVTKEYNDNISTIPDRLTRRSTSTKAVTNFYETVVKNFTDADYIKKLKMSKATVQALILFIKEYYEKPNNAIIPLDKKVHVFLWILTSEKSFQKIGEKFDLHKSTVSYIFHEIATLLSEQRYQFINWPSVEEQHVTSVKVNSKYGFPNCVGFIDACCFKVGPKRKKNNSESILVQAVCNENLMFIDVHIGEIGNTQKNQLFRDSRLAQELQNFVDINNHILGDEEYNLQMCLLTPFITDEIFTDEESKFNNIHQEASTYIKQAFRIFRKRFKKLNHIDISKPEAISTVMHAACVLHNFILLHEGSPLNNEPIFTSILVKLDTNVVTTATEKRQFLSNYINYKQES